MISNLLKAKTTGLLPWVTLTVSVPFYHLYLNFGYIVITTASNHI